MGRPLKLKPDDKTLATIAGCAQIQCTYREASAILDVSQPTFEAFLRRHKKVRELWDKNQENGKASLRRTQFRLAQTNTGMAIFLGKNYLGQTDQVNLEHGGTVQHNVSVELQQLLKVVDGNSRSLPTSARTEANGHRPSLLPGPRVEARQPLPDRERGGGNGHLPEE